MRILAELKHKEGMALAHEGCEGDMHFWAILDLPEDWQSDDSIRRVVESYDKGKWPSCAEHMDWGSLKITRHKEPHDLEVENAALRARLAKYE